MWIFIYEYVCIYYIMKYTYTGLKYISEVEKYRGRTFVIMSRNKIYHDENLPIDTFVGRYSKFECIVDNSNKITRIFTFECGDKVVNLISPLHGNIYSFILVNEITTCTTKDEVFLIENIIIMDFKKSQRMISYVEKF